MPDETRQATGYCRDCGGYGRGRFVEVINHWSDAIDQHIGCQGSRQPDPPPISGENQVRGLNRTGPDVPRPLHQPSPGPD